MIIKLSSGELKMVVILTTALALGIGAVAACVVPWFYCKPKNDGDDEREPTAIEDGSGSISRSRSINDENSSSTMGVRIHGLRGFNFIRVVIPRECVTSNISGISVTRENTTENSTLRELVRENLVVEQPKLPIQTSRLGSTDLSTRRKDERSSERAFVALESSTSGLINSRSVNPPPMNSGISNLRSINSAPSHSGQTNLRSFDSRLLRVVEENLSSKGSDHDASILPSIDESAPKMASRTVTFEKSELTNVISRENTANILPATAPSESSNQTNVSAESTNENLTSHSSRDTSSILPKNEINIPTAEDPSELSNYTDKSIGLTSKNSTSQESKDTSTNSSILATATSSDSSNTAESSTETTQKTSTFQESVNSSNTSNVSNSITIEIPKVAEFLETINETSIGVETSQERSSQKSSSINILKSNENGNARVGENVSETIQPGNSNLTKDHLETATPMVNSSLDEKSDSVKSAPCIGERIQKSSRRSHFPIALSDGLKKAWRRIKFDRAPRTPIGINRQQSGVESVQSLSAGAKIPTGHSTLNEPTKSIISNQNSSQLTYDENSSSLPQKNYGCTGGFSKEVFREVADFLRVKRGSVSSEEGATRSGSVEFHDDFIKSCGRDENENLTSDRLNTNINLKMENTTKFDENSEENRLDSTTNVKENKFSQKIKKMFNRPGKIGDKIMSSGKREKNLGNVSVEFQRDSTETSSRVKNDRGSRDSRSSESSDIASYLDLGFSISGDEGNVPCTEL